MDALDIFSYLDYREYCRDFYRSRKSTESEFSFRSFGRKAQVASSYLKHVMDGRRNLSPEMSLRFAQGMDLSSREADYFENLVRFNQAASMQEKELYLDRLRKQRARGLKSLGLAEAAALLSHWYVVAIKELVCSLNLADVSTIQRLLRRRLPESLIQKTLEELQALGWLQYDGTRWSSSAHQIQFPDEVRSFVIRSFHQQILELAKEALADEIEEREFGAAVFTFPHSKFPKLKEKIKELQRELVLYVQEEGKGGTADDARVYSFGVQCFSLTKGEQV